MACIRQMTQQFQVGSRAPKLRHFRKANFVEPAEAQGDVGPHSIDEVESYIVMSMPARLNDAGAIGRLRSRILVRGAVQGVGFRPFVHRQATALGLAGWVINSSQGVVVEAEGDPERIAALVRKIRENPPANSAVDIVETSAIALRWDDGFEIRASDAAGACTAQVLPDFATCAG